MIEILAQTAATGDMTTMGALIAVILTLSELVKWLAKVALSKTKNGKAAEAKPVVIEQPVAVHQPVLCELGDADKQWIKTNAGCDNHERQQEILKNLLEFHEKTDADGTPLIYAPRQMMREQTAQTSLLREIRDELMRARPRD